jgi:hypothetical protein
MATYRILLSARFVDAQGVDAIADSLHLVDGVTSAAEAEVAARRDAGRAGVEVVAVRVMEHS